MVWIVLSYLFVFITIARIYVWGNPKSKIIRKDIETNLDVFWKDTIPTCIEQLKDVSQDGHLPVNETGLVIIVIKELQIALDGKHLSYFSGSPNPQQNILEEINTLLLKVQSGLPDSTTWSQKVLKSNLGAVSAGVDNIKKLQRRYNFLRILDTPDPIDLFK